MAEKHRCPRRVEGVGSLEPGDLDTWNRRHGRKGPRSCSFCGSLHPEDFLEAVRNQTATVEPTDKSYKAYVTIPTVLYQPQIGKSLPGGGFKMKKFGPKQPAMLKFYFQHLSREQQLEVIDLYNSRPKRFYFDRPDGVLDFEVREPGDGMLVDYPGYFYVTPYFVGHQSHGGREE